MTPEERRTANEDLLRERGIPVNPHLPMIEGEDGVRLRSEDALWRRLLALWGVVGTATLREHAYFKEYFSVGERRDWLSGDEAAFIFNDTPAEADVIRFSWRLEAMIFLAWCGGLVDELPMPEQASSAEAILPLYPHDLGDAGMLRQALRLRDKAEILDWADLLYRLHWAVRDAQLHGRELPPGINPGMVLEWHHAANWMICYEDEDDWDAVGTDT
ncbi:DUF4272 domain-containing protein [Massilia sp. LjRoot122]|uniref:DUF4272 domain-containing protein n=1 Tax=Massilia sp. LjRoot122 TaxID=3342257 RepID=UPI003ECE37BB